MVDRETFREFVRLLNYLADRVGRGRAIILVEGERDRAALLSLGLPVKSIRVLNRGTSLVSLGESLAEDGREVILLTDWDFTGGRLAHRMSEILQGSGLNVDTETRRRIARATGREVREVENLHTWAAREADHLREPFGEGALLPDPGLKETYER